MKLKKIIKSLFFLFVLTLVAKYLDGSNPILFIDGYDVLDTTRFIVRYRLEVVPNIERPEATDSDIIILEIGSRITKSYSYGLFRHDSIATRNKHRDAHAGFRSRVPTLEVFKNHPIGRNTIVHRSPYHPEPVFLYEDHINIDWQILSDRREIMGYQCQKAIATFRGREWVAWFSNQIPVFVGPLKFQGLPGLIMEITDKNKHFNLSIVALTYEKYPIKMYNWAYQKTTREKANDYFKWCHENFYDCNKNLGINLRFMNRTLEETKKTSIPYNPLELE
jgi:GLPGLI family protein